MSVSTPTSPQLSQLSFAWETQFLSHCASGSPRMWCIEIHTVEEILYPIILRLFPMLNHVTHIEFPWVSGAGILSINSIPLGGSSHLLGSLCPCFFHFYFSGISFILVQAGPEAVSTEWCVQGALLTKWQSPKFTDVSFYFKMAKVITYNMYPLVN